MATTDEDPPGRQTTHLGFCVPTEDDSYPLGHTSPYWENWDGGQVGGRPSWLQPRDIPMRPLRCTTCSNLLRFVCQLYAPADQVSPNAFHRSLYVFACTKCCSSHNNHHNKTTTTTTTTTTNGIRILRAQLPQDNPFYRLDGTEERTSSTKITSSAPSNTTTATAWNQHESSTWNVALCVVCGQRAKGKCPLQHEYFCSKEHQTEFKRYRHTTTNNNNNSNNNTTTTTNNNNILATTHENEVQPKVNSKTLLPSVFPKWELVVEDEAPPETVDENDDDDNVSNTKQPLFLSKMTKNMTSATGVTTKENGSHDRDEDDDDDDDSDADLEQDDLNNMTGASNQKKTDPITTAFYERLRRPGARNQCIRYRQWPNDNNSDNTKMNHKDDDEEEDNNDHTNDDPGVPLWIRSDFRPTAPPPDCPHCGAPRKFEFQILPQMLHYLQQQQNPSPPTSSSSSSSSINDNSVQPQQRTITSTTSATTTTTTSTAKAKEILEHANALADQVPPELLPANFEEQRQAAVMSVQQQLFKTQELDWGTIVVYTCTASCQNNHYSQTSTSRGGDDDDNDNNNNPNGYKSASGTNLCNRQTKEQRQQQLEEDLGAYMEEYAWWQPPLDDV